MSDDFNPPPPEPIHIATGKAYLVGALTLTVFTIAISGGWLMIRAHGPAEPMPPTLGAPSVGIVSQVPFSIEDEARRLRRAQRERLQGYGWVDRDAGIIHQPVEQAMDQLLGTQEGGPR